MSSNRFANRPLALAGVMAIASCRLAPPPAPVPVQGSQEELTAISGEWAGRYWSKVTGRHGTIQFRLPEHADTGFGEVEITFSPSLELARAASAVDDSKRRAAEDLDPGPCTVIDITLVRVEGDRVRGVMAPYWDPDCDCRTQTVFEGRISGNRITGTFSSQRASSDRRVLTGKWQAERT
jgi:hypothetical protein